MTYSVEDKDVLSGIAKASNCAALLATVNEAVPGLLDLVKITFSPVLNGWLGRWIERLGTDMVSCTLPIVNVLSVDVVPTPTESCALKKAILLSEDLNSFVFTGKVILSPLSLSSLPKLWATPAVPYLLTRRTPLS